jgi:cerevisin
LDDDGYGSYYEIVQALGVIQQRIKTRRRPTVVSISISGGRNDAINRALEDLLQANILLPVVAAGNANQDASNWSPASANVLTVGATDIQDKRSSFSNYGAPVKIFAPGSNIVSTCPRQALCAMSGTSMATPIVAGIAATVWSHQPKLKPRDVLNKLVYSTSLKNILRDIPSNTANRLVHLDPIAQCLIEQVMILQ